MRRRALYRNKSSIITTEKQSSLRDELLSAGILQKMDIATALAHESTDPLYSLTNLTGNTDFDLKYVEGASTLNDVYSQGVGVIASGISFYYGYTPSSDAVNLTLNDAGFGYMMDIGDSLPILISSTNNGASAQEASVGCIGTNLGGFSGRVYVNNGDKINSGLRSTMNGLPNGFFSAQTKNNSIKSFIDGTLRDTTAQNPQALSDFDLSLFNQNNKAQFIWVGASLSDAEHGTLNTILKNYINNL